MASSQDSSTLMEPIVTPTATPTYELDKFDPSKDVTLVDDGLDDGDQDNNYFNEVLDRALLEDTDLGADVLSISRPYLPCNQTSSLASSPKSSQTCSKTLKPVSKFSPRATTEVPKTNLIDLLLAEIRLPTFFKHLLHLNGYRCLDDMLLINNDLLDQMENNIKNNSFRGPSDFTKKYDRVKYLGYDYNLCELRRFAFAQLDRTKLTGETLRRAVQKIKDAVEMRQKKRNNRSLRY